MKKGFVVLVLFGCLAAAAAPLTTVNGYQSSREPVEIGVFNFLDGVTAANLQAFETSSGRHAASVLLYQKLETNGGFSFPEDQLNEAVLFHEPYDSQVIPMITWEPEMSLAAINSGTYDQAISAYAANAAAWNHPLRIRFAHEMIENDIDDGGDWYSWQDQPEAYKAAFQRIVTAFRTENANQVQFVWCPNHYPADADLVKKYYPGGDYVDWLCMDGYNWTNQNGDPGYPDWQTFDQIFAPLYTVFTSDTAFFGDKPVMIGEFGSCEASAVNDPGLSKADWITETMNTIKGETYPKIRAFYWFNADKSGSANQYECNWRIDSSPASETAFRNAVSDPIFISHPTLDHQVFLPLVIR